MEKNLNHSWNTFQYARTSDLQAAAAEDLLKNLEIKPDEIVLDVGCGIGNITMTIASITCRGSVVGIDNSSAMIDQANNNLLPNRLNNISFRVMSAMDLNFNKEFDVVISNSVFHWIKEQERVLQLIYRSIKPGGRIGIQFPILDASHPMIRMVNEAILRLNFRHIYEGQDFPWFVPESGDKYAELINQFKYKNVTFREIETFYTFENKKTVINFFKSVGLELLLEPFPRKDRILLEKELISLVGQHNKGDQIRLPFRRLYIYAGI